ncbi:MAG: PQ-loop domain-containing transporter [Chloroflexota bacterium]
MISPDLLGLVAGAMTTCSIIPQVIRVFRLKSAREISFLFTTLMLLGMSLWLVHGICVSASFQS